MIWSFWKRTMKVLVRHIPDFRLRIACLRLAGYQVGRGVYLGEDLIIQDEISDRGRITIGERVAIASRVTLVTVSSPNNSELSEVYPPVHGSIIIEDDAWIGTAAVILPGVHIGAGSVIGASALVTRSVPSGAIVKGIPARVSGYVRFDKNCRGTSPVALPAWFPARPA